jgi:LTXXQ motif family protein
MLKGVVGLVTVLFVAGSAYAQSPSHESPSHGRLTPTDINVLTDARLGIAKAVLQLTPEQAKYWPAVEQAIRARAEARYRRITELRSQAERAGQHDLDPIEFMRGRADALAERAANLKRLVDAWQPLYQTLTPDQKQRVHLVTMHVLGRAREAVENRRMEMMESDEGDVD